MNDWKEQYDQRDWTGIDNWWRQSDDLTEIEHLRDRLRRDVPTVTRENGTERTTDYIHPAEAPEEWRGAAQMLFEGELDAKLDGDPPTAAKEWEQVYETIVETLVGLSEADEVTSGDAMLSRAAHARQSLELLKQIDLETQWMCSEIDPTGELSEDRNWITQVIAHIALSAFAAGAHAQIASGKEIEFDAIRGQKVLRGASESGILRRAETRTKSEAVLEHMRVRIDRGHSASAAARHTYAAGLGTSSEANRKLWVRNRTK